MGTPPEDDAGAGEGAPAAENDPAKKRGSLASRIDAFMSGEADLDDDIPIDEDRPRRPQSAPSIDPGSIEPIVPARAQSEPGVDIDVESIDEVEEIVES